MAHATSNRPQRPRSASPPGFSELVTRSVHHATPRRYHSVAQPRRLGSQYGPPRRRINPDRRAPLSENSPPPSAMSRYREPRASHWRSDSYGQGHQDSFFSATETMLSPPLTPAYQPPSSPGFQRPRATPSTRYSHGYLSPFPSPALSYESDNSTFTGYRGYEPGEESLPLTRRPMSEVQFALEAEERTAQRDSRWKRGIRQFRFVVRCLNFGCSIVVMALLLDNLTSTTLFENANKSFITHNPFRWRVSRERLFGVNRET